MRAVLFDFGHTLFEPVDELARCRAYLAGSDATVSDADLRALAASVRERARTPEEIAKGRDLSEEAHRRCWLDLLAPFDDVAPGLAAHLYEAEIGADGWVPYPDTVPVLEALAARGVPIGVVSDAGWDIRVVFAAHGLERFVDAWVVSYEHGVAKPAPALFHAGCRQLGVEPAATVMVGDNHLTDGGASSAGLCALILPLPVPGARRGLGAVVRLLGARG